MFVFLEVKKTSGIASVDNQDFSFLLTEEGTASRPNK